MIVKEIQIDLQRMALDAEKAARFYEERPGLFDVRAIVDIYRAIARLAVHVEQLSAEN